MDQNKGIDPIEFARQYSGGKKTISPVRRILRSHGGPLVGPKAIGGLSDRRRWFRRLEKGPDSKAWKDGLNIFKREG